MTYRTPSCKIVVNGTERMMTGSFITYNEVCRLADVGDEATVTWATKNSSGIMHRGQSVPLSEGMIFNACYTGAA